MSISGKIALVNVAIPVENRFLKVKSVTSKVPVISTSLNVAIPDTLRLSKSKLDDYRDRFNYNYMVFAKKK